MSDQQCPLCYGPLEVREVTPCAICGGWPESVARFDSSARFTRYRLPNGQLVVLCQGCELEEFMVPNGWGYRLIPDEKLPVNALRRISDLETPCVERDKLCVVCNLRLVFAEVVSSTGTAAMATTFGSRDNFAVEAYIEPDCENPVTVWGRTCIWCRGNSLGNINESYCAIGQVYGSLLDLMHQLDELWAPEFKGWGDEEIMNFLDEKLYGRHGDVEVADDRTINQVAADASKWGKFDFLTQWGAQFNNCKAFIVRPSEATLRILSRDLPNGTGYSVSVSRTGFLAACEAFITWFEEESRRLGIPCRT